jgi:hypothetical protein
LPLVTGQREDALALYPVPAAVPDRTVQATRAGHAGAQADLTVALAIEPMHQAVQGLADGLGARR